MVRHRGGQGLLGEAGQAMCSCSPPTDFLWVGGDKSRDQEDAYPKGRTKQHMVLADRRRG